MKTLDNMQIPIGSLVYHYGNYLATLEGYGFDPKACYSDAHVEADQKTLEEYRKHIKAGDPVVQYLYIKRIYNFKRAIEIKKGSKLKVPAYYCKPFTKQDIERIFQDYSDRIKFLDSVTDKIYTQ